MKTVPEPLDDEWTLIGTVWGHELVGVLGRDQRFWNEKLKADPSLAERVLRIANIKKEADA